MENTPSLAGQPELFLTNQLILMREGVRKSEVMAPFVKGLKDDVIIALAAHYAKLPPEPSEEPVDADTGQRGAQLAVETALRIMPPAGLRGPRADAAPDHQRLDYLILTLTAYREGTAPASTPA